MATQQEGNNEQLLIQQHNTNDKNVNIDIDIDMHLTKVRSRYQQKYFKLCGKTRRLPSKEGILGIVMSICFYLCGTTFYEIMCISLIISNQNNTNFSSTGYIVVAVAGGITFIITQLSYFDIATSIPGYQTSNRLTEEEYKSAPPVKVIQDSSFTLKYCSTCKIARDVRTFHCRYCNMCIERHDHHCGYVSNCIGKDNMKKFFYFLCTTALHCSLVEVVSLYTLGKFYLKRNGTNQNDYQTNVILIMLLSIFVGFFLVMVVGLIIKHLFMFARNETTNELLRKRYNNKVFDKGMNDNCKEIFCNKETNVFKIVMYEGKTVEEKAQLLYENEIQFPLSCLRRTFDKLRGVNLPFDEILEEYAAKFDVPEEVDEVDINPVERTVATITEGEEGFEEVDGIIGWRRVQAGGTGGRSP